VVLTLLVVLVMIGISTNRQRQLCLDSVLKMICFLGIAALSSDD